MRHSHRDHSGNTAPKSLKDFFAAQTSDPLASAFASKKAVHPFLDMSPVPDDRLLALWQELTRKPRTGKSVAYIHIPFCENHCLFCGFYQNPWRKDGGQAYTDAVINDLKRGHERPYQAQGPIHAVYFGGGTPSALSPRDLYRLLDAVHTYLPLAPDCEITIEGRVHSFTPDKISACFDGGANRISIGIQTFNEKLRRRMGRKADRAHILSFLDQLVSQDRGAIVIDLIYGFPDQTIESWQEDVHTATTIGIDGIDLYSLNLIPGTPLLTVIEKGKTGQPVPVNQLGTYYARGVEVMEKARWETISTTHWRSSTRERNLYNLLVKKGANCLAYGSGAGGFLGEYSYRIERDLKRYMECIRQNEPPVSNILTQSDNHQLFNRLKGEMETGKLNLDWLIDELSHTYDLAYTGTIEPLLQQWRKAGLLEISNGWLELTLAGRFWQVSLTQSLLEWINQNLQTVSKAPPTPTAMNQN